MNIPEGYKLVPVKANCDQLHAGASKSGVLFIYEAMVKAAPAVELNAYDEAKERELCMIAYEDISDHTKAYFKEFKQGWLACAKSRARSAE